MSSAYCLGLTQYIETSKKIYVNMKKYLIFARKGFIIQSQWCKVESKSIKVH